MTTPFTNVYGLARSLLALCSLVTLLTSDADTLFRPLRASVADAGFASHVSHYGLFALLDPHFEIARWIAVLVLAVVASGWRPRVTGVPHWWVTASLFTTLVTQDGGDQCASALTFLIIPLALCDDRKWHWLGAPALTSRGDLVKARVGASALFMARVQVALVYLHAAAGKLAVPEWVDGTAIYYWLLDTRIGVPSAYHGWVHAALAPQWVAPALTWSPLVLEFCLFLGIAMGENNRFRPWLFWIAIAFHIGNMMFFGLVSFMIVMSAALVLLLRPATQPYALAIPAAMGQVSRRIAQIAKDRAPDVVGQASTLTRQEQ